MGAIGEWFKTIVIPHHRETRVPTIPYAVQCLFRTNHERHVGWTSRYTVSIGGRQLTNLRFADDVDGLVGSETELRRLVNRLERALIPKPGKDTLH